MNQKLQQLVSSIQGSLHLSDDEKDSLLRKLKDVDKEIEIISFKLDRTEKVKRTTTILLEETIEELEQRRKAVEAQNHELEVESSLERVRTVSLSMKQPGDMLQVCRIISEQLQLLGIKEIRNIQTAIFYQEKGTYMNYEYYAKRGKELITETTYGDNEIHQSFADKMLKGYGECMTAHIEGDKVRDWIAYQETTNVFIDEYLYTVSSLDYYWYSLGPVALGISTYAPLSEEEIGLFKRFLKVFELSYRRYLDIENAEVQAREAKIEACLERTRTQSMMMQRSEQLDDTLRVFHEQVLLLGIQSAFSFLWLPDEEKSKHQFWAAWAENNATVFKSKAVSYPLDRNEPATALCLIDWKGNVPVVSYHVSSAEVKDYFTAWSELIAGVDELEPANFSDGLYYAEGFMKYGCFGVMTRNLLPDDEKKILGRFANEFERTYTRFLDLQKAEAQAREAQIETGLERVRSRSLAMHHTSELQEVIHTVHKELLHLNIAIYGGSFIAVNNNIETALRCWGSGGTADTSEEVILPVYEKPFCTNLINGIKNGPGFFTEEYGRQEKVEFFTFLFKHAPWSGLDYKQQQETLSSPGGYTRSCCVSQHTSIFIINHFGKAFSEDDNEILKRFAKVFEQAYTRFLDLEKAEAQTREAKIEAAMEKVRSRATTMQKPGELVIVAELLRKEMGLLGVEELETSSIYVHHEDTQKTDCWYAIKDVANPEKELVSDHMTIDLEKTWVGKQMLAFCQSGKKQVSINMQGAHRKEWINYCADHSKVLLGFYDDDIPDRTYHLYRFSDGYMGAAAPGDISPESWNLLQRATTVFSLAYTRFNDLQKAEAQAKEATIEAALERVRSRTLAMQKSNELAETAAVLFRQLIGLGIEPNRLYITIIKDRGGDMEFWITDEDGSRVSSKFSGNAYQHSSFQRMYEGWQSQQKSIIIDMQGEELANYFHHLSELNVPFKSGLSQKRRIQNIAYFGNGFIGMASPEEQGEEVISLLERFAAVFNLTYTRFNDLQVAESHAVQAEEDLIKLQTEKKRAEDALAELRETQKQLIQSEKMASLGELTAGIAHEIQNPLNFVNNFSELNNELIEELKGERLKAGDKRDSQLEDDLLSDIAQNLQKINEHGKRADAIVKGMLQHSRATGTVKEPTDINALADEYIRLCYHGLRAKDKTFNSAISTDFDPSINKINIIPQDIGRVILNITTNAFYAVNERKKKLAVSFDPLVSVSTKRLGDKVEIQVRDNGGGIPQNIIDKIFQPFFTTKPTGQGTGLGLSLAYDIVKAHGGEIKVEPEEGKGTIFMIVLPFTHSL